MGLLEVIVVVLLFLWLLGAFVVPFGGNLVHALAGIALILVVVRLSRGQSL